MTSNKTTDKQKTKLVDQPSWVEAARVLDTKKMKYFHCADQYTELVSVVAAND